MTQLTLTTVNLATPDPPGLARFYQRLLGWEIAAEEPHWVKLDNPAGGSRCRSSTTGPTSDRSGRPRPPRSR